MNEGAGLPRLLRRRWPWLLLAILARVAFALKLGDRQIQIDEIGYRSAAWQLATTGAFDVGSRANATPPVPGLFFALWFLLGGPRLLWPRLAQALLGVWTAFAVGEMTEELSRSRLAGRLALAVACVYPFFIYYGGMVMSEALDLALLVPGLWWVCSALGRTWNAASRAAAGGLALSLAALCRSEGAFIAAAIWAAAAVLCAARRWSWKAWAVGVAVWLLPLLGWCARNRVQLGAFALDTHSGMAFLHGGEFLELNQQDTGLAQAAIERQPFYQAAKKLPAAELNSTLLSEAIRFMKAHPALTLRQWAYKLIQFWRFYPRLDKPYAETQHSHPSAGLPRWILVLVSLAFEPWLVLGGLWGLWRLRGRIAQLFPLYLWVLATMAVHVVSVSQMRYRLPLMPVLILGFCALVADAVAQYRH